MKRDFPCLSGREYDLTIVGGGIYGAYVAWDAASRGLSVALVEKGDFGNATSANSQKIIHGGLRYLQHGDFLRMRESIRERSTLMRIAPQYVFPMPFLIPLYGTPIWKKIAMSIALRVNDLIGFDRNRGLSLDKIIPNGSIISKDQALKLAPNLDVNNLKSALLFHDAQVLNPDRLTLAVLLSAAEFGASLVNYAEMVQFLRERTAVAGIQVRDKFTGELKNIKSKVTVSCSGPWTSSVLGLLKEDAVSDQGGGLFKAVVLVSRQLFKEVAVGISSSGDFKDSSEIVSKGYRYFFVTPWRGTSLIGTFYFPFSGDPNDFKITEDEIAMSINEINEAYPAARLKREDIYFINGGLLPKEGGHKDQKDIQYEKRYKIIDYQEKNGVQGLVSVEGVKYTTARDVAEKTVNLILKKLKRKPVECKTKNVPVYGGGIENISNFLTSVGENSPKNISHEVLKHLVYTYGEKYREIIKYSDENPSLNEPVSDRSCVSKAEVLHAVRCEMAQRLSDVILRRTDLGTAGYPGDDCLRLCAEIMQQQFGWDEERVSREIEETKGFFR